MREAPIFEAAKMMARSDVGVLPVGQNDNLDVELIRARGV